MSFGGAQTSSRKTRETDRLIPNGDIERGSSPSPRRVVDDGQLLPGNAEQRLASQRRRGIYKWLFVVMAVVACVYALSIWRREPQEPGKHGEPVKFPGLPPPTNIPRNDAYLVQGSQGAVAAEEVSCSQMGVAILKRGGSAVDAAIAATLCVGVINSFSSGIGGGGFMILRIPDGKTSNVTAIDFRETGPTGSTKNMYTDDENGHLAAQVGGLAVGVPGELRGLEAAHRLYGKLSWKDVVTPAADMAAGFRVGRELARRLRIFGDFMLDEPAWSAVFAPRGALLVEGEWIQRLNLSRTLHIIAEDGAQAFYEGTIAESVVRTVQEHGGHLTMEDLTGYEVKIYPAISGQFYDKTVYTTDAPSSGGVLLGLLKIMEHFKIGRSKFTNLQAHRFVEGLKMAFGARSEISDPAFANNTHRHVEIHSPEWVKSRVAKITDNTTHSPDYYDLIFDTPEDHGTTHLVAVDGHGGVASVTSTVNLIFGSRVMDPATGVIMNDEQDDFSIPGAPNAMGLAPSPFNYPTTGKRPLSSTSPVIIENADGSLYAALGGSGGSRIFGSVAQVMAHLENGLDISQAIEAPRLHDQIFPQNVSLETGFDRSLMRDLERKGHTVIEFDINLGIAEVQGIMRDANGTIWAASDSRKNGIAAGY